MRGTAEEEGERGEVGGLLDNGWMMMMKSSQSLYASSASITICDTALRPHDIVLFHHEGFA